MLPLGLAVCKHRHSEHACWLNKAYVTITSDIMMAAEGNHASAKRCMVTWVALAGDNLA